MHYAIMIGQTQADPTAIVQMLTRDDVVIPVVIGTVITITVVFKTIAGVIKTAARERSRREIAAYIAEGTMTAEQGERLLKAGDKCSM